MGCTGCMRGEIDEVFVTVSCTGERGLEGCVDGRYGGVLATGRCDSLGDDRKSKEGKKRGRQGEETHFDLGVEMNGDVRRESSIWEFTRR